MRTWLLGLTVLAATSAAATDMTAYGLEIGKPLGLPACPAGTEVFKIKAPCIDDKNFVRFQLGEGPIHAKSGSLGVRSDGDGLSLVILWTAGAPAQPLVLADLTKKYGPPTSRRDAPVTNAMGAHFDAVEAHWRLDGPLQVDFYGTMNQFDQGLLLIGRPEEIKAFWAKLEALRGGRKL